MRPTSCSNAASDRRREKPPDRQTRNIRRAASIDGKLDQGSTRGWPQLEAMAAEAKRVEQAGMHAAGAHHRAAVGCIAVDPGPYPDDIRLLQVRHDGDRRAAGRMRRLGPGPRAQPVLGDRALAAAEDDIAARDLAQ